MSPYGKFLLEICDENITLDLQAARYAACQFGFNPRNVKIMCLFLGLAFRADHESHSRQ